MNTFGFSAREQFGELLAVSGNQNKRRLLRLRTVAQRHQRPQRAIGNGGGDALPFSNTACARGRGAAMQSRNGIGYTWAADPSVTIVAVVALGRMRRGGNLAP